MTIVRKGMSEIKFCGEFTIASALDSSNTVLRFCPAPKSECERHGCSRTRIAGEQYLGVARKSVVGFALVNLCSVKCGRIWMRDICTFPGAEAYITRGGECIFSSSSHTDKELPWNHPPTQCSVVGCSKTTVPGNWYLARRSIDLAENVACSEMCAAILCL